ncbi:glutamyl-tRNA reductase [Flavihumibacter solisilvae]|uniref:Glutamyl-tRNA reductase n=1 Tax=Flavihumibacter solisilvae TaxID=1349421 RepID=A0A0C1IIB2_9BACT|nr:glutamyl-tRNA reductase [Flavihumibacter solisilvae]KIC93935.1 hypothetical protein OI18_15265 [Flavihumibacter solisilvae]
MIAVAGISYYSAGFDMLAKYAGLAEEAASGNSISGAFTGIVWVSTCNRVEIYADIPVHCRKRAERLMLQQFGLTEKTEGFYIYTEDEAILHLLKVAAGLDSAVTGEDQVLGQLKLAYKNAVTANLTSPWLNRIFHKAFETGKSIRNLTDINKGHQSIASIAVALAGSFVTEYPAESSNGVLILGAGETGALVAEILVNKGFSNISIWNRSTIKARKLAVKLGLNVVTTDQLEHSYRTSSVVMVAIRNKEPLLNYGAERTAPSAKRLVVDLSMPFQVADTAENANNYVYNLSHIAAIRKETLEKRKEAIDDAMQLIWSAMSELATWKEDQWIGKTLQQWKLLMQQLKERQVRDYAEKHPEVDSATLSRFGEELSANILRQLAWSIRQQQKDGADWNKWSKLLANVEPYEQLN